MVRTILGIVALVAVSIYLIRRYWLAREQRRNEPQRFFARAFEVLENAELQATGTVGYPRLIGLYGGLAVQVHPVVDTLPTRRLPAFWLLVTVQSPLPVSSRFDLMMRPTAATTFSNFDSLPATLQLPTGFPEGAVIRTDDAQRVLAAHIVRPHLEVFVDPRAKELLITPNGVRLVWLLAEANRARYGVMRDAEFGEIDLDPALLRDLLDRLVAIRRDILESARVGAREAVA